MQPDQKIKSHFLAISRKLSYLRRWIMMDTDERESVSEHSFQVAYISHLLASIEKHIFQKDIDINLITVQALYHDFSEAVTGDMPTPIKHLNREITSIYQDIERQAKEFIIGTLPEALRPTFDEAFNYDGHTALIIKQADVLSSFLKCKREIYRGNQDFTIPYENILVFLKELETDALNYFMKNFVANSHSPQDCFSLS